MKKYLILTTALFIICISAYTQKITKKELLGSYSLKRIDYIYADTTIEVNPSQSGFLILSPERYAIAYNPGLKTRVAFKNLSNPTEDEIQAGFKSFAFNSGSYKVKNGDFVVSPDFAKVPGFEGGKQVYAIEKISDQYIFTMYDETYPSGEKPSWYGKLKIKLYFDREK